jgi:hypothetical protein
MGKLRMNPPLWRTRLREPLVPYGDGHGFHKSNPLCTGLCELPVGDVGNRVPAVGAGCSISKSPELHRQDLENPAPAQVVMAQPLRTDFHFSCCNYGNYCLFLLSNYSFPTPPSHSTAGSEERAVAPQKTAASIFSRIQRPSSTTIQRTQASEPPARAPARANPAANRIICPGIQKYIPLFHPHREAEGEYNQSRRRDRPFRLGRNVL